MAELPAAEHKPGSLSRIAMGALWLYQHSLSPAFYAMGVRCRHEPTCSHYATDAYRLHGAWRGSWLTFSRLARCHPFGSHGFDPVPEKLAPQPTTPWKYGDWAWHERGPECGTERGPERGTERGPECESEQGNGPSGQRR